MRNFLLLIIFSFFNSFLTFASPMSGLNKIIEKGYITVMFTENETALFSKLNTDGTISGIDMDIAKRIADGLGVKLVVKKDAENWNQVIDKVSKSEADFGISFLSITTDRSKKVLFSDPYVNIKHTILFNSISFANASSMGLRSFAQIFSDDSIFTLGVLKGSSFEIIGNEIFTHAKKLYYNNDEEMISAVVKREVDAVIINEVTVYEMLQKEPELYLKITKKLLKDRPDLISIAVNPQNRDLLNYINNVLNIYNLKFTLESAHNYTTLK